MEAPMITQRSPLWGPLLFVRFGPGATVHMMSEAIQIGPSKSQRPVPILLGSSTGMFPARWDGCAKPFGSRDGGEEAGAVGKVVAIGSPPCPGIPWLPKLADVEPCAGCQLPGCMGPDLPSSMSAEVGLSYQLLRKRNDPESRKNQC